MELLNPVRVLHSIAYYFLLFRTEDNINKKNSYPKKVDDVQQMIQLLILSKLTFISPIILAF